MENNILQRIDSIIRWTVICLCAAFIFSTVGLVIVIIVVLRTAGI